MPSLSEIKDKVLGRKRSATSLDGSSSTESLIGAAYFDLDSLWPEIDFQEQMGQKNEYIQEKLVAFFQEQSSELPIVFTIKSQKISRFYGLEKALPAALKELKATDNPLPKTIIFGAGLGDTKLENIQGYLSDLVQTLKEDFAITAQKLSAPSSNKHAAPPPKKSALLFNQKKNAPQVQTPPAISVH